MLVYDDLLELEAKGEYIGVGVIGAGQMGMGMISQIATIPAMHVVAVCDINEKEALKASDNYNKHAKGKNNSIYMTDFHEMMEIDDVKVVVDATGIPETGAQIAIASWENKKHLVLLNVEVDITIGYLMRQLFESSGLVYTGSDGDEPAATKQLHDFANAMGMNVLVAGKGKNNKLRLEANPSTVAEEARSKNMSPYMLASFADGTKTMAEMTLLANAIGFKPDKVGMHGITGDLEETVSQLKIKSDGGVLNHYGVVEYVDGLAPGVFVIVEGQNDAVKEELNYLMKEEKDHHILYRPYHLASLETPLSIARAALYGKPSIVQHLEPQAETVAVAKKDIQKGEEIDGIGGYCVRGTIVSSDTKIRKGLLPIGLIQGKTRASMDIHKGSFLTEENTELDRETLVYKLRMIQDDIFNT